MTAEIAAEIIAAMLPINLEIPCLNRGGCGVYAAIFAEEMQSLGYSPKVIELNIDSWFADYSTCNYKSMFSENIKNIERVMNANSAPNSTDIHIATHLCVQIDEFYFDSNSFGIKTGDNVTLGNYTFDVIGEIPIKDIDYISIQKRGSVWNEDYNPKYNAAIKEYIKDALSFLTSKQKI